VDDPAQFNLEPSETVTVFKNLEMIFEYIARTDNINLFLKACNQGYFILLEKYHFLNLKTKV
jgi:hypothetical protein